MSPVQDFAIDFFCRSLFVKYAEAKQLRRVVN